MFESFFDLASTCLTWFLLGGDGEVGWEEGGGWGRILHKFHF